MCVYLQTDSAPAGVTYIVACGLLQVRDRLSSRVDASSSREGSVSMNTRTLPQAGMSTLTKSSAQHCSLCDGQLSLLLQDGATIS